MINCAVDLYYILHCYYYIVYLHIDIYLSVTIKLWSVFTAVQVLTLVLFIKGFVLIILHIPLIIFFSVANLFRTNPQTIMIIFFINMTKKFIMCGMWPSHRHKGSSNIEHLAFPFKLMGEIRYKNLLMVIRCLVNRQYYINLVESSFCE